MGGDNRMREEVYIGTSGIRWWEDIEDKDWEGKLEKGVTSL